jgi:methylmalonyl-CoA mutase
MSEEPRAPRRLDLSVFPPVSTADWDAAVRRDLKGADYDKRLVWRPEDGVSVKPFYREEDVPDGGAQRDAEPGALPVVRGDGTGRWEIAGTFEPPADAVRVDLLHDAGATSIQELAYALAEGVDRLDAATADGRPAREAAADLTFVFAVGGLYFLEMAKLRAARLLWAQVVSAFDPGDASKQAGTPMRLHVRTARQNKSTCDPYSNLLRVTTEAMAAAIGGGQVVTVEATGFAPHLAVNVQRILDEEAHLGEVADPAGGSYYVEALTAMLARQAWSLFQEIEAEGGYREAVRTGRLEVAIAAARAEREKAFALRRRTLVGVNNYPDAADGDPSDEPWPQPEPGVVSPWRAAEPIERIRARTSQHARASGSPPRVHLVTRGDVRMRTARANFCRNFFGCAGFAITESADVEPADLLVLCSADAEYPGLARDVVPVAAAPVVVAGHPVGTLDTLRELGVADFVHMGSDIVATLDAWQDRLGLERLS